MSFADSWYRASCALLLFTLHFSMFPFYPPPLSFSPSPSLSLSLFLSLSLLPLSLCGCKTNVIWCPLPNILFLINLTFFTPYPSIAQIKFTNYSPTIFYNYHPQSCLKTSFSLSGQPSSSWCCQVQKFKKSRRIALFWMLSSAKNEEVSQNCFVLDVVTFKN